MKKTDPPVIIEQNFDVSTAQLWDALTQEDQMRQWFFENMETFEPEPGFETRFVVENEGRVFPHLWKITEVIPLQKITINWKYEGYAGDSLVTFALAEQDKGSLLVLTHRVTEDFPEDVPEFRRESCTQGWKWFIRERLREYLGTKN
jgi:uncharacterized protein YndB with AHSA1/START domain